jgi:hypothetical protein
MQPWQKEAAIAAASVAGWFLLYGLMLLITRPRHIWAAPAAQELGPEPPAVVSMLANGWEVTEDAVESTLLDLGARKYFEFRQPANDPRQTTIHVVPRQDGQLGDLTPYERSVYQRVTGLAHNGLVPLSALTFRDDRQATSWWKTVRGTVVADARARGLSQRRFSAAIVSFLTIAALVAAAAVAYAAFHSVHRNPDPSSDDDPFGAALAAFFFSFIILASFTGRNLGERDTPKGREVAARWLGVKQVLRGNDGFTDLPPSAVAVWDRYLAYGAALGTTRVASAVIDMGMGNRRRVWSSFGGTWHRVRISYPSFWARYGQPAGKLIFRAVLAGVAGGLLVRFWREGLANLSTVDFVHGSTFDRVSALISPIGYGLGVVLLGYGAYTLIRVIIDLATPKHLSGQVLWLRVWRTRGGGENSPAVPWLYYAAIDNGTGDRTRAWGLPAELERRCDTGDTVNLTVRRWSRRVIALEIKDRGAAGFTQSAVPIPGPAPVAALAAGPPDAPSLAVLSAFGLHPGLSTNLLTADEVGQALGLSVALRSAGATPVMMTTFISQPKGRTVLIVQMVRGGLAESMFRRGMNRAGAQQLPGVGDGAWIQGNRGVVRSGDSFVSLILGGPAKKNTAALPTLLGQAASRIPRQASPVD